MIVLVDMDEVLCDFKRGVREGALEAANPMEEKWPQSKMGFFAYLHPIPGAIEAMKLLQEKHDVWICSRPSYENIFCYTEKAIWIRKHLGLHMQKKLILMPNKSMCIGDVLIDDSVKDGQLLFKGRLIRFGSENYPTWESVLNELYYTDLQ